MWRPSCFKFTGVPIVLTMLAYETGGSVQPTCFQIGKIYLVKYSGWLLNSSAKSEVPKNHFSLAADASVAAAD